MARRIALKVRGRGERAYASTERLLVSGGGGRIPCLTPVGEVRPGDYVGVRFGAAARARTPLPVVQPRRLICSEKPIRVPEAMTPELAFFLGAYMSEGHTTRSNWSVIITNAVPDVLNRVQDAIWKVFGLRARLTHQPGRCTGLVVSSKRLVELMDMLGCGGRASAKRVPPVMFGLANEFMIPFLQGVALDAYTTVCSPARWAICLDSADAIQDLQDILTTMGIPNSQLAKWNKEYEKHYHELYCPGVAGQDLSRLVPFLEPDKRERAQRFEALECNGQDWTDVIPGARGHDVYELIPRGKPGKNGRGTGRQSFRYLRDKRTKRVTRQSILRAEEAGAELPRWLGELVHSSVRFYPVLSLEIGVADEQA